LVLPTVAGVVGGVALLLALLALLAYRRRRSKQAFHMDSTNGSVHQVSNPMYSEHESADLYGEARAVPGSARGVPHALDSQAGDEYGNYAVPTFVHAGGVAPGHQPYYGAESDAGYMDLVTPLSAHASSSEYAEPEGLNFSFMGMPTTSSDTDGGYFNVSPAQAAAAAPGGDTGYFDVTPAPATTDMGYFDIKPAS
jgi:hypothetical protein